MRQVAIIFLLGLHATMAQAFEPLTPQTAQSLATFHGCTLYRLPQKQQHLQASDLHTVIGIKADGMIQNTFREGYYFQPEHHLQFYPLNVAKTLAALDTSNPQIFATFGSDEMVLTPLPVQASVHPNLNEDIQATAYHLAWYRQQKLQAQTQVLCWYQL